MQIVIDIPEDIYERCRKYELRCGEAEVLEGSVAKGTPLPKGHGRLIDVDLFAKEIVKYSHQSTKTIGKALADTPTIIEADKEDKE